MSQPLRTSLPALALPAAFAGLLALARPAQQEPVPLETRTLAPDLYMLEGVAGFAGGNVVVWNRPDGVLLVDGQFDHQVEPILGALARIRGGDDPALDYLVNTHYHRDHTGGNARLVAAGATVLAHENVHERLAADESTSPSALPVVTYADGLTLRPDGHTVRLFHFPSGHTDGDSAVWFEHANVLHLGDLFFNRRFPYIDRGAGGSARGIYAAVDSVLAWLPDDAQVVPGHGPLGTVDELRAYRTMLGDAIDIVTAEIEAGRTLEEARAGGVLDEYGHLSWNFITTDRFLDGLWAELAGE